VKLIFLLTFTVQCGGNVCYRRINPTKSLGLFAGSDTDADVTICDSARNPVHTDQFVCAFKAVEVSVLVCLSISCNNVTEVGGPKVL
jgi:hypothetical protein